MSCIQQVLTGFDCAGPIYQDFYVGPKVEEGDVARILEDANSFEDFSASILALIPSLTDESIRQTWRGKINRAPRSA